MDSCWGRSMEDSLFKIGILKILVHDMTKKNRLPDFIASSRIAIDMTIGRCTVTRNDFPGE